MRVGNGCPREIAHLSMIIHTKTKALGHVEYHFMSERLQFLHKNVVKIYLMPAGRHDVFKDGDPHAYLLLADSIPCDCARDHIVSHISPSYRIRGTFQG